MQLQPLFDDIVARHARVLVIGLGVTGIETARFLHSRGAVPVCIESKSLEEYRKGSRFAEAAEGLKSEGIELYFGVDLLKIRSLLKGSALCVISPGVPLSHPLLMEVQRKKIPVTSEFELGIELAGLPSVVVTGSNGKSTVVTLVDAMLKAAGFRSFLCGNIGRPVISQIGEAGRPVDDGKSFLVVEASSYQLESCESLKPKVGVFLNLSNNHLERHGSMEAYFEAKKNLFIRQDASDVAIVNTDDPYGARIPDASRAGVVGFGVWRSGDVGDFAQIQYDRPGGVDRVRLFIDGSEEEVFDCTRCQLVGRHTRYNVAAAVSAARSLGVGREIIENVLETFRPLEHRLEVVTERDSVIYINDSKSTTVASTCVAVETVLEYFPPKYLVLLIGGLAKRASWESMLKVLKENEARLRGIICFGKDGGMLRRELRRIKMEADECATMKEGVLKAMEIAHHNDVVLLSPGCASFDEFRDFEERGDTFRQIVGC